MTLFRMAVWFTMIGWLLLDAAAVAQVSPPRRGRRMMVSQEDLERSKSKVSLQSHLDDIAQRISRQSKTQMAEVIFVIDGSAEMRETIEAIEKGLPSLVSTLESAGVDYRLALISFQFFNGLPQIQVSRLERDFGGFQDDIRGLRIHIGDSGAAYGLDAMMQGLRELEFRPDASRNLIVVTANRLKTAWEVENAESQLTGEIIALANDTKVHINVIGVGEFVQTQLAQETGGKWYPIDENQREVSAAKLIDKSTLTLSGIFRRISEHITETIQTPTDIVFVFDSSLSMETKVEEICSGVDRMALAFDSAGLDYRFGVIRFWAQPGGGESSVLTTKPPLNVEQVKNLFRIGKRGDEHLLDAIMEGVPRLNTPAARNLVLVILTDESTSNRLQEKGYNAGGAISVCQGAGAQVYVVGGVTSISSGSFSDEFQKRVTEVTKGLHFIMPGSTIADERR